MSAPSARCSPSSPGRAFLGRSPRCDSNLPGLAGFAAGLGGDLEAVTRGLTTRWSSGPIEGRVNHVNTVKRQMYGRAGLPLLRKRVLLTASR
jgi:transposase